MDFVVDGVAVVLPPPEGYKANFANPTQRQATIAYVMFATMFTISTLCFFQYMFVKLKLLRTVETHVVLVMIGWIFGVLVQAMEIYTFSCKIIGVHAWEMPIERFQRGAWCMVVTSILTTISTGFCKTALALFYYGLSPQRWWRYTSCVFISMEVGHSIAIFVAALCGCRPFARNWDLTVPGVCINRPMLYVASAALSTFSDFILLIMPIPMILGLRMPARQKIGVAIFFTIGALTLVTATLRLIFLLPTLQTLDLSWEVSNNTIVLNVEANLNIICVTFVTLRTFFLHVAPGVVGQGDSSDQECGIGGARFQRNSFVTIGQIEPRKKRDEFGLTIGSTVSLDRIPKMGMVYQRDEIGGKRPLSISIYGHKQGGPSSRPVRASGDSMWASSIWDERPYDENESERAIFQPRNVTASPKRLSSHEG